jgi:2-polyprenyl-3-methyl-5-hydroxy-6-metoxy-1,4-benzoquinol methylase
MPGALPILGTTRAGLEIVPCALCGGTRTRRYCRKFGYPIVKCRACTLVYCNPRLTSDQTDKRYNAEYFRNEYLPSVMPPGGPDDGAFLDDRYGPSIALLRRSGVERGRLIEIGTGAGFFLKAAARAGWDAHGLELSTEASAYARETLGLNILQTAAEAMPFEPGTFDAAAMFEVIEHLRDPVRVLTATRQALRPGGVLVLSTPNLDAISRWVLGKQWAMLNPAEHLYYFTRRTLAAMLLEAGFSRAEFVGEFKPWLLYETMNVNNTHAPGSFRARVYRSLVFRYGADRYREIQRRGYADGLLAVAFA